MSGQAAAAEQPLPKSNKNSRPKSRRWLRHGALILVTFAVLTWATSQSEWFLLPQPLEFPAKMTARILYCLALPGKTILYVIMRPPLHQSSVFFTVTSSAIGAVILWAFVVGSCQAWRREGNDRHIRP